MNKYNKKMRNMSKRAFAWNRQQNQEKPKFHVLTNFKVNVILIV